MRFLSAPAQLELAGGRTALSHRTRTARPLWPLGSGQTSRRGTRRPWSSWWGTARQLPPFRRNGRTRTHQDALRDRVVSIWTLGPHTDLLSSHTYIGAVTTCGGPSGGITADGVNTSANLSLDLVELKFRKGSSNPLISGEHHTFDKR